MATKYRQRIADKILQEKLEALGAILRPIAHFAGYDTT